jgi:hypothetical protein
MRLEMGRWVYLRAGFEDRDLSILLCDPAVEVAEEGIDRFGGKDFDAGVVADEVHVDVEVGEDDGAGVFFEGASVGAGLAALGGAESEGEAELQLRIIFSLCIDQQTHGLLELLEISYFVWLVGSEGDTPAAGLGM